jgi:hypothetical protein
VKLFADANTNNVPDGPAIATTTTDANGFYSFTGLTPGNYIVGITAPAGYAQGFTTLSSLDPNNNDNTDNNGITIIGIDITTNYITLTPGTEPTTDGDGSNGNLTLDFALKGTGSIGDLVWNDANRNGIQDIGETGISGVIVTLTYPGGATTTTTTNSNGEYLFSNLAPGNYSVSFATPSGYFASPANQGSDDTKDSDPNGGPVAVTLAPGQNNTTIDAGFYRQINLSGNVWHDVNGLTDFEVNNSGGGTAAPIPSPLFVYLVNASTNLIERVTIVMSNGTYSFPNISPNTLYYVYLSSFGANPGSPAPAPALPTGWNHTGQNLGAGPGNDFIPGDGRLTIPPATSDVINANFGIQTGGSDVVIG